MTVKREQIVAGNIYHVLSRGVDKRNIFLNDDDYLRFTENLSRFNNEDFNSEAISWRPGHYGALGANNDKRESLVDLLAFCLMPNHYHLLIRPIFDDGLSKFVQKMNHGYAQYFNRKNNRQGTLFESRYKIVPIISEAHFTHIPYYIHFNPLDLIGSGWRKNEIGDMNTELRFIDSYRWSSHLDYSGTRNFPSVTSREFLLNRFGDPDGYKKSVRDWLSDRKSFEWMEGITLE